MDRSRFELLHPGRWRFFRRLVLRRIIRRANRLATLIIQPRRFNLADHTTDVAVFGSRTHGQMLPGGRGRSYTAHIPWVLGIFNSGQNAEVGRHVAQKLQHLNAWLLPAASLPGAGDDPGTLAEQHVELDSHGPGGTQLSTSGKSEGVVLGRLNGLHARHSDAALHRILVGPSSSTARSRKS